MQPWTDAEDATLRKMWAAGASVALIMPVLNRTKNSIIGRSHRLGCQARENPSKPRGADPVVAAKYDALRAMAARNMSTADIARETGLPRKHVGYCLHRMGVSMQRVAVPKPFNVATVKREPTLPKPPATPGLKPVVTPRPLAPGRHKPAPIILGAAAPGVRTCKWIMGEAAGCATVFCDAPAQRGPYCGAHAALAYVPTPKRDARAA